MIEDLFPITGSVLTRNTPMRYLKFLKDFRAMKNLKAPVRD